MKRLENKSVIITAAGQGIGRETVIRFLNEGANVIATDINRSHKLEELSKQYPKIKIHTLDSTNANDVKKFCNNISKIDILFNCVGFVHNGNILECEEKDWDFSFNVNVRSMYLMIKNIIPKMVDQKSGVIINMASVVSSVKGVKDRFVYGATKAAVIGLTKSIAVDFLKYNIRCNAIAPGFIETEMTAKLNEDVVKGWRESIPLKRGGTPEDVANVCVFLASDMSAYVTGQVLNVDGGMLT